MSSFIRIILADGLAVGTGHTQRMYKDFPRSLHCHAVPAIRLSTNLWSAGLPQKAAPSGEIAHEYGTGHVSYNEHQSGKHIAFTAAYLRVWRAEGSVCKLAAEMFEPE